MLWPSQNIWALRNQHNQLEKSNSVAVLCTWHCSKNHTSIYVTWVVDLTEAELIWCRFNSCSDIIFGHQDILDRRLCRPKSKRWPWSSNLCTMSTVKLCWHNFTQSAYFMIYLCLVFLLYLMTNPNWKTSCYLIFEPSIQKLLMSMHYFTDRTLVFFEIGLKRHQQLIFWKKSKFKMKWSTVLRTKLYFILILF